MELSKLKDILLKNKHFVIVGVFLSIIYSAVITMMPLMSKYLIDEVMTTDNAEQVYIGITVFFCVTILQPIFYIIKERIFAHLAEKVSLSLRETMVNKMINLPLATFERLNYGEISTKIIIDTREISSYILFGINNFITNTILVVLLTVLMFVQNVMIAGAIILLVISYVIINSIVSKKFNKIAKVSMENNEKFQNNIKQNYDKVILTKTYSDKIALNAQNKNILQNIKTNNIRNYNLSSMLNGFTLGIVAVVLAIIYGAGALLVLENKMTLGTVIALGLFFQTMVPSINSLIMNSVMFNRVKPSIKRVNEYLNEPEEKGDILDIGKAIIDFQNVSFGYKDDITVLSNLTFTIDSPGVYAFVGPSGSGKSTISKLILGLYEINNGEVFVFENNIKDIYKESLRQNISYVSQDADLIYDSILNNIIMGNKNYCMEDVYDICEYLQIKDVIESLPDGYNAIVNDKVSLSGGEKKRIAICRAVLKKSAIYIFDEAEASLPIEMYDMLSNLYEKLSKESIVIIITHQHDTIRNASKIYKLNQKGELI